MNYGDKMNHNFDVDLSKSEQSQSVAQHIMTILQDIRFGSIEIVVHDGRIVQIDKHEKFRIKSQPLGH
jgi:hypothetical protein